MVSRDQTRDVIAGLKMKVFDQLTANPGISNAEISRRVHISPITVRKYKKEWEEKLRAVSVQVEQKILEKTQDRVNIWQKLMKMVGFN